MVTPSSAAPFVSVRRSDALPRTRRAAAAAVRQALLTAAPPEGLLPEEAELLRLANEVLQRLPRGTNVLVSRTDVLVDLSYQRRSLVRVRAAH